MTSEQRYQAMLEEIRKLRAALIRMHKAVQEADVQSALSGTGGIGNHEQSAEILASIDESLAALAIAGKWEGVSITPAPPFSTVDFYAGGMHTLSHLLEVAKQTQGAGVWEGMLGQMRVVLQFEMKEKGLVK